MTSVHPTQIESFGTHCSLPECHLGDFLPFTCTYCAKPYCSSHRTPESHQCPAYDAAAQDVRATICPLCNEAIPVSEYGGRNADINVAMDAHFENGRCKVLNQQNGLIKEDGGNAKKLKGQYQCKFGRCENRNWADIKCDKCGKGYCPSHREPKHHKCAMASTPASSSSNVNLVPAKPSSSLNTAKPSLVPVKAAFSKLNINSPASPTATNSSVSTKPARLPSLIPSSARKEEKSVSKRAAKERESAALALKKRAEKGLLSEDEKVRYATLQAMEAKGRKSGEGKDKDCCIS